MNFQTYKWKPIVETSLSLREDTYPDLEGLGRVAEFVHASEVVHAGGDTAAPNVGQLRCRRHFRVPHLAGR